MRNRGKKVAGFVTWRNRIVKHLDKKDVSPLEYDLDKDAQVAHANIAIVSMLSKLMPQS